jgi:hypothetical protein
MVGAQIKVSDLNERRRCRKGFAVQWLGLGVRGRREWQEFEVRGKG